jgi:hypothetical protein
VTKPPVSWDPARGQPVAADFVAPPLRTVLGGPRPKLVPPSPEPGEAETPPAASPAPAPAKAPSRDELLARQAQLHRERGKAALDGSEWAGRSELLAVETLLEVGEDVEAETVRRERERTTQVAADRRAQLAARLGGIELAIADAMRVAQLVMDSAVRGLLRTRELTREVSELARRAGAPPPASLMRAAQDKRFGAMVAEALWPIRSTGHSLGDTEWQVSAYSFSEWSVAERSAIAADLAAIMERTTP